MTTKALAFNDFLNVAIRRKWLILASVAVSLLIAWAVCLVWPKSYRSTTTIVLESQKIPETYVKGVVTGTIPERMASIRQVVLSRQLLKQVIDELQLLPDGAGDSVREDAFIAQMRKAIIVDNSKEQTAFKISYAHASPETAQNVTARLAALVVDDHLRRREQLIEGATEFLHEELRQAKNDLEAKERAITDFKGQHMGELPQQMEANLRALDRLQIEMSTTSEAINTLGSRLDAIEKAIRDYQAGETSAAAISTLAPNGLKRVDKRRERLRELEQRLAALSAEYKETYPDIIHLKEEIKKLRATPLTPDDDEDGPEVKGDEKGKVGSDPYLAELVKQRAELRSELALQKHRQERVAVQIKEFEGRVERTPAREQQLMILQRDYENLQKNYQSLLEKKLSASISENLERRQKGEQFRIIDPANFPRTPETPNEILIMLAGFVAGCGIGYGGAFWLEHGRGLVRTPDDAESLAGLPILATIPQLQSAYGRRPSRYLPQRKGDRYSSHETNLPALTHGSHKGRYLGPKQLEKSGAEELGGLRMELNLVARWRPYSLAAEQYRVAATRIVMASSDLASTVIIVTSSIKGEGKSSSVSNLGHVLASDLGKRTLLIDCDFKRPSLHRYHGITASPGLTEVLKGHCAISEALRRTDETGPWILTSGSREQNVVDLGQIPKLREIISGLRAQFDYIILDAPPVLPLADMNLLSALADFLVFIVRADMAQKSVVESAVRSLRSFDHGGVLVTGYTAMNAHDYLQDYYFATQGKEAQ